VPDERFEVDLAIEAYDRQGLLRDVTSLFANARINVLAIQTQTNRKTHAATMRLKVEVTDLGSLSKLLERLNRLKNVISARRLTTVSDDEGQAMAPPRYRIEDLLRIMERLRDPEHGCPWDLAQDFESIVPSTLEECYELAAAIEAGDFAHVADELGDVLFQVVFYAQLGRGAGPVQLRQRRARPCRQAPAPSSARVSPTARSRALSTIAAISGSGQASSGRRSRPRSGPGAPSTACWTTCRSPAGAAAGAEAAEARRAVGFDWADAAAVLAKLDEESEELREALATGDAAHASRMSSATCCSRSSISRATRSWTQRRRCDGHRPSSNAVFMPWSSLPAKRAMTSGRSTLRGPGGAMGTGQGAGAGRIDLSA
jgi:ATP diphosphatase